MVCAFGPQLWNQRVGRDTPGTAEMCGRLASMSQFQGTETLAPVPVRGRCAGIFTGPVLWDDSAGNLIGLRRSRSGFALSEWLTDGLIHAALDGSGLPAG